MRTPFAAVCLLLLMFSGESCRRAPINYYDQGVSVSMAEYRSGVISDLSYSLSFMIPPDETLPIKAEEIIIFDLDNSKFDLLIDFRSNSAGIDSLSLNGKNISWSYFNDHISIPAKDLNKGVNKVFISFTAGDMSLNRNGDFLYTLLVPDRASTTFPCFDQPNLKAKFNLTLKIDSGWTAIANNPLIEEIQQDQWKIMKFGSGKPISTYLFAFSAGKFKEITRSVDGISMQMLHRETDNKLVESNIDEIFNLHARSIKWLEEYTGISYPFDKFGFILIPSFQYGGMEHPGSIYYRASSLFLENNSSINQELSRAGLIAHETAHIWFGDLVTMDWFNDVWLKEVFAGFMSDKITNPSFPDIDHEMRFLFGRYPAAYSVDRTTGANPIIQELENMKDAGSLYGAIIYNKAPIVMRHLEMIMGEELLREGLRGYLKSYSYKNATWDDLVSILDTIVDTDLKSWSNVWVKEAGMPHLQLKIDSSGGKETLSFREIDPDNSERHWPQVLKTLILYPDHRDTVVVEPSSKEYTVRLGEDYTCYIPDYDGITYGLIRISPENIIYLINNIQDIGSPLTRGSIWINTWENMLDGAVDPESFLELLIKQIPLEDDLLLSARLRSYLGEIYWNNLDISSREKQMDRVENLAFEMVQKAESLSEKRAWFNTYQSLSSSPHALQYLYEIWSGETQLEGISFSETDYISMSYNLALKQYSAFENILKRQSERILNSDRKKEYLFIIQALDSSSTARDLFFSSLKEEENREHEPWVTRALSYLHHPLYADRSVKYIPESLNLLSEIQKTGDIFFPGQWISTTLSGHSSYEAYEMVNKFLIQNPDYPNSLKLKILQAYDHLHRRYGNNN